MIKKLRVKALLPILGQIFINKKSKLSFKILIAINF